MNEKKLKVTRDFGYYVKYVKIIENNTEIKDDNALYLIQNDLCIWQTTSSCLGPDIFILHNDNKEPIAAYKYTPTCNPEVHVWVKISENQIKQTLENGN